ncbi:baculoviral IAP repeat-containing protein 8-like [Mercenaria mercenaria]|uniref:baculoviral IAP repeat-containing protein 8-like n=1 Tax=Mercenaria mercenaria TaxID=6596 RepID=UPI00234EEEAE|nr:baculoviral IAP repeat-containing protein 8-like [Mercenaria mercenaria]
MADNFARNSFPRQVSSDQASQERSEIAFSNEASFSAISAENGYNFSTGHHVIRNGILNGDRQLESAYTQSVGTTTVPQRSVRPARYPDYIDYSQRLQTYTRWKRPHPGPVCLCEAGFFFTDQGDLVRCFQCGIGLKDFSQGDDPIQEHVRYSGECQYLLEHLGAARLSTIKNQQAESNGQARYPQHPGPSVQCRHPEYQTFEARVSSFTGWPNYLRQTPAEFADAGLYYTGLEDHVRCFMCDGELRRWDPDDVPWREHIRWFPACEYAREKKGNEFIAPVQASDQYNSEGPENEEFPGRRSLPYASGQINLRDPVIKAVLEEHKNTCLEMGYQLIDFNEAVEDLRNMGSVKPTIEEIIEMVEIIKEKKHRQERASELERRHHETLMEENMRLKSLIICMTCGRNAVNTLFIPCTHHRMCMECAEPLTQCPVCQRHIRQKIRTYLA